MPWITGILPRLSNSFFERIGDPDPWGSVINPLCGLIKEVDLGWNALKFTQPEPSSLRFPPDPESPPAHLRLPLLPLDLQHSLVLESFPSTSDVPRDDTQRPECQSPS